MKAIAFFNTYPNPLNIRVKGKSKILFTVCFCIFFSYHSFSQSDTSAMSKHSPKKAAIMSACLPGLGQIYNKKYWKLPIIYTAAAAVTYFAVTNTKNYKDYRDAYIFSTDGDSTTVDPYGYGPDLLLSIKNYYRHNLELTYIVAFGIYALNIIDASVDAHLFDFSVDDNLSMKISPAVFCSAGRYSTGLSLAFNISQPKKIKNLR